MEERGEEREAKTDRGKLLEKCAQYLWLCMSEIESVRACVQASALAFALGEMKYEADQPLSDSGWGRSGLGSALRQGSLS